MQDIYKSVKVSFAYVEATFFCPETKEGKSSPFMVGYSATGSVASDRASGALLFALYGILREIF